MSKKKLDLKKLSVNSFITAPQETKGGINISYRLLDCNQTANTLCPENYTCGLCAYSGPADTCDPCNTTYCPQPI